MLGEIFKKARPEIQDPAKLRRLIVELIDREQWSPMQADVKGDIYEGLLQRSAAESPKGAGQYFTPRELIHGVLEVMQPTPEDTVCDPAVGTGGFLLAAHDYVVGRYGSELNPDQTRHLRHDFVRGVGADAEHRAAVRNEPLPARDRRRDLARHLRRGQPGCGPR